MNKRHEFDLRELDANGDAFNVMHFDTERAARLYVDHAGYSFGTTADHDCAAVVIERHDWRKHDAGDVCASYDFLVAFGDPTAVGRWNGTIPVETETSFPDPRLA